jgi:anti-sigma B factor antagonist
MNINETKNNDIIIFSLEGRLDSNTSEDFERQLMTKIDDANNKMIIEFSALDYISSAGLRVLLMAAKRLKIANGSFVLCGLKTHLYEIFEISGFLQILTIVNNLENAQAEVAAHY